MNKDYDLNQTNFSSDRPMFENEVQLPVNEEIQQEEITPKVPLYKNKKIILGAGAGLIVILLLILIFVPKPQDDPNVNLANTDDTPAVAESGPFIDRIKRLRTELDGADPTKPELIYPPVNMDIYLDEPDL